jgi:hypothetical protein
LYGGGIVSVSFQVGDYKYNVYAKNGRLKDDTQGEDRTPYAEDGLLLSRNGKPIQQLVCDDGGQGFRSDISWLPDLPQDKDDEWPTHASPPAQR